MQKLVVYMPRKTVYEVVLQENMQVGDVLGMLETAGFEIVGYEVV